MGCGGSIPVKSALPAESIHGVKRCALRDEQYSFSWQFLVIFRRIPPDCFLPGIEQYINDIEKLKQRLQLAEREIACIKEKEALLESPVHKPGTTPLALLSALCAA